MTFVYMAASSSADGGLAPSLDVAFAVQPPCRLPEPLVPEHEEAAMIVVPDEDMDDEGGDDADSAPPSEGAAVVGGVMRFRNCKFCSSNFEAKQWRLHQRVCVAAKKVMSGTLYIGLGLVKTGPWGEVNPYRYRHVDVFVGAIPKVVQEDLVSVCRFIHSEYAASGKGLGCKPQHRGILQGVGYVCGEWYGPMDKRQKLKGPIREFAGKIMGLEVVQLCRYASWLMKERELGLPAEIPIAIFDQVDGSCCFFGINYSPHMQAPDYDQVHGHPPPAVSHMKSVTSCRGVCEICTSSIDCCVGCQHCPWNLEPDEVSASIHLFWQHERTPVSATCIFMTGMEHVPINGGVCVILSGKEVKHGLWVPPAASPEKWPWFSYKMVRQV
jgi:hypothetical protein